MLLKRLFRRRATAQDPGDQRGRIETAIQSPDVSVRLDGCRQLTELSTLRRLGVADPNAGVRELAEARFRRLLCGLDDQAPPLAERLAELSSSQDQTLLAQVAGHGGEAELRLAAIRSLEDPEALAGCAIGDDLAANRLAATERIWDKHALERIVKGIGKRDKRVFRLARERLKTIAEREERPRLAREHGEALCQRLERLGRFDAWVQERAVLEHVEQQWAEIALEADEALHERFALLRQRFLDGYDAYRREHAAQLAKQEAHLAAAAEREALIERLTRLVEPEPIDALERLDEQLRALRQAWEAAPEPEPAAATRLDRAFADALGRALDLRRDLEREQRREKAAARLLKNAERLLEHAGPPEHKALDSLRRRRAELGETSAGGEQIAENNGTGPPGLPAIDALLDQLAQRLERHQRQVRRKLETLPERLGELERHLESGELKKADPLYQSIAATLEQARGVKAVRAQVSEIEERLKQIAPQLRELRYWRRWSTDEHRAALCAAIEALAADDQHPDEPSINHLQELKAGWKELDRQGAPADDALWERFRRAADHVRERCKDYLSAQAALRSENRKQREALAKRLEDFLDKVDWERVDWKKLQRAEREMREAWSNLANAPGGGGNATPDRALEGRFRRALRRIDKTLAEERERNQAEKRRLIERLGALVDEPDLHLAIDNAKKLQKQWHTTVSARHRDENALWQEFRTASDAIFARRNAEHEARNASLRENQSAREAICRDLAKLADQPTNDAISAVELASRIKALKTRWSDTEALPVPRQAQTSLTQRWRDALAAASILLTRLREAERWARLDRLARCGDYCDKTARQLIVGEAAPTRETLEQGWSALPVIGDAALEKAATSRFAEVLKACDNAAARETLAKTLDDNLARREELCLQLEVLAMIPSPPALETRRMELQVQRLRGRMGEGVEDRSADASSLIRDWYLAIPAAASSELDARLSRIKTALRAGAMQPAPTEDAVSPSAAPA